MVPTYGAALGLWRTVKKLRALRPYDAAYLAQGSFRSGLLAMMTGARDRIGFTSSTGRVLYTRQMPYRPDRHHGRNRRCGADGGHWGDWAHWCDWGGRGDGCDWTDRCNRPYRRHRCDWPDRRHGSIWGYRSALDTGTITVHIRRLRTKIEDDPSRPRHLETVFGAGYRFTP